LKNGKVKQVRKLFVAVQTITLPHQSATVTQKCLKTRDVRLCFREGVRMIDGKETAGYYCMLCLKGKTSRGELGWQTGNITARRRHLGRKHYDTYRKICESNGLEPKEGPPPGWNPPKEYVSLLILTDPILILDRFKQMLIEKFMTKATKPPKVTKAGIQEHLLELIVDCDLVRYSWKSTFYVRLLLSSRFDSPSVNCYAGY